MQLWGLVPLVALLVASGQIVVDQMTPVSVDVFIPIAPERFVELKLAPVRFAPFRIAPFRIALFRLSPVRLALVRFAPVRFVPCSVAFVRSEPARLASVRSAASRVVPFRVAPDRFASVSVACSKSVSVRFAFREVCVRESIGNEVRADQIASVARSRPRNAPIDSLMRVASAKCSPTGTSTSSRAGCPLRASSASRAGHALRSRRPRTTGRATRSRPADTSGRAAPTGSARRTSRSGRSLLTGTASTREQRPSHASRRSRAVTSNQTHEARTMERNDIVRRVRRCGTPRPTPAEAVARPRQHRLAGMARLAGLMVDDPQRALVRPCDPVTRPNVPSRPGRDRGRSQRAAHSKTGKETYEHSSPTQPLQHVAPLTHTSRPERPVKGFVPWRHQLKPKTGAGMMGGCSCEPARKVVVPADEIAWKLRSCEGSSAHARQSWPSHASQA